jgi:hypothetical protein
MTVDEHRDAGESAILELRAAVEELAALAGLYLAPDVTPALHRAIKATDSGIARLAAFHSSVEAERRAELERDLEQGTDFERRMRAEAATYRWQREQDLARLAATKSRDSAWAAAELARLRGEPEPTNHARVIAP